MRPALMTTVFGCFGFNPRTREGCDPAGMLDDVTEFVSIHAPVKDATVKKTTSQKSIGFQSTHP